MLPRGSPDWESTEKEQRSGTVAPPPPSHLCLMTSNHSHENGGRKCGSFRYFCHCYYCSCFIMLCFNQSKCPHETWCPFSSPQQLMGVWFPYQSKNNVLKHLENKYVKWNDIVVSNLRNWGQENNGKSEKIRCSWDVKHTQDTSWSGAPVPQRERHYYYTMQLNSLHAC